jgi:hypothetical protein
VQGRVVSDAPCSFWPIRFSCPFTEKFSHHSRTHRYMGCNCNDGFVGPVCEFVDMEMKPIECNLVCSNNGICRKGAKDLSALQNFTLHGRRHLVTAVVNPSSAAYNEDFEHCVCPAGYAGLRCEFQVDLCPGTPTHICMNGGSCEPDATGDSLEFTCDCDAAKNTTSRFTGNYCEMASTQFCTTDKRKTEHGKGQYAFCTNGGQCRDFVVHGQE